MRAVVASAHRARRPVQRGGVELAAQVGRQPGIQAQAAIAQVLAQPDPDHRPRHLRRGVDVEPGQLGEHPQLDAAVAGGQHTHVAAEVRGQAAQRQRDAGVQRVLPIPRMRPLQAGHQLLQVAGRRRDPGAGGFPGQQHQRPGVTAHRLHQGGDLLGGGARVADRWGPAVRG